MDPQQQFCLKWNSYSSNLASTFSNLFKSDLLADVTLSCEGILFKAHKLILAACSKKFSDLFETTPTNSQLVVILEATSSENMAALLEFMYKGEVHVSQEALNSFLKSAENLQVKGLSTETGRLAAQQAQQHEQLPLDSPTGRRNVRNSLSGGSTSAGGNAGIGGIGGNGNNAGIGSATGPPSASTPNLSTDRSGVLNAASNIISAGLSGSVGANLSTAAGVAHHMSASTGNLKQECDSLMHASSSTLGALSYVQPMYRPVMSFEPPPRKRALRSPYAEHEIRGSVLRDGSKNSSECASPINKQPYRPSSSASSTAPTEAETLLSERASPQSSRYENHSPNNTAGNGNAPSRLASSLERSVKLERNNGSTNEAHDDEHEDHDDSMDAGAEDLRVKLENSNYSPPPISTNSNTSPAAQNSLLENLKVEGSLAGSLAASIAPADMLNVWNATKLNNKNSGMVNTADGKKLKCLYCDRLYGYETNLRAHIRQRHQGIRVPCPFCSRTFTRNNTVRRHIAREHKQEMGLSASSQIAPAHVVTGATTVAAHATANHSQ